MKRRTLMSNQNQKRQDQQQKKQGQQPAQKVDQDEIRKAEIRKAVKEDMIDPKNPQGQQDTDYSGGT
jgi:hypothetical protein